MCDATGKRGQRPLLLDGLRITLTGGRALSRGKASGGDAARGVVQRCLVAIRKPRPSFSGTPTVSHVIPTERGHLAYIHQSSTPVGSPCTAPLSANSAPDDNVLYSPTTNTKVDTTSTLYNALLSQNTPAQILNIGGLCQRIKGGARCRISNCVISLYMEVVRQMSSESEQGGRER